MTLDIPVVIGSIRQGRNTPRLARFILRQLRERDEVRSELIDLRELDLPLLEERLRFLDEPPPALDRLGEQINRADAVVIATPEYNKGYPAALKNAIDALGAEWRRKPVGIVAHSVGAFGGMVVLQQLRIVLMNLGAVPIPAAMTCPHVDKTFAPDGAALDEAFEGRGERFVDELVWYARALRRARMDG